MNTARSASNSPGAPAAPTGDRRHAARRDRHSSHNLLRAYCGGGWDDWEDPGEPERSLADWGRSTAVDRGRSTL